MGQEERTYDRFSVLSVWQRYIGGGLKRGDDGKIRAPEKWPRHPHRGLDVDMYFYDKLDIYDLFEESTDPVETKPTTMVKQFAVLVGGTAYAVQSPSKPPSGTLSCGCSRPPSVG